MDILPFKFKCDVLMYFTIEEIDQLPDVNRNEPFQFPWN